MSSDSSIEIPIGEGHVGLVLLDGKSLDEIFYLEIPLDKINANSLNAASYLLYVGWCVLGVEGTLALESGSAFGPDDTIQDQGIYHYVYEEDDDDLLAIDLEVIMLRSAAPSETTATRENFHTRLLSRDVCCVWSGFEAKYGDGLHIIPFRRGSEWLQLIVANRPHYDEAINDLDDINDIRNGVFVNTILHRGFDSREVVILKTPNPYLDTKDIPRTDRHIFNQVSCPRNKRYTLQWLIPAEDVENVQRAFPNNLDAAFRKGNKQAKPSDLLLHYNYGAAAVKLWGRNIVVLTDKFDPPRPKVPVPAASGPKRGMGNRQATVTKLKKARDLAEAERGKTGGKRSTAGKSGTVRATKARRRAAPVIHESPRSGVEGSAKQTKWDEDDVMLFLWGNSQAAKERHSRKTRENAQRMERWTKGFSYV